MAKSKKPKTFAEILTQKRTAAEISIYRLAQLSGVSREAISKLEEGTRQPTWETVQKLCKALGVPCEEFVTLED